MKGLEKLHHHNMIKKSRCKDYSLPNLRDNK